MSWEDFKKKKKNSPKPGGCYFYTPFYCKGLHDVLLNRGQVLCSQSGSLFNSCIKKKGGSNYETGLEANRRFFIAVNTKQTYRS